MIGLLMPVYVLLYGRSIGWPIDQSSNCAGMIGRDCTRVLLTSDVDRLWLIFRDGEFFHRLDGNVSGVMEKSSCLFRCWIAESGKKV